MLRRSERKRENRQDKKVFFTEGNKAVKDYRASFQPSLVPRDNVVVQYKNDPEHSDAIDKIQLMSMKAKSSKKLPRIIKPLDIEEEENPIDKFKREQTEENLPKEKYSTKTYTQGKPKKAVDDSGIQYYVSPYFDKVLGVETVIKTDYDPAKLMFPKKDKKAVSPIEEKENEKTYLKTEYKREKLFPKKENIIVSPKEEKENEKTNIRSEYKRERLFPKREKNIKSPNNETEEKTYLKTEYEKEKIETKKEEPKKEERPSSASRRRWYNRRKEENPTPVKETPPEKPEIISTTIIENAKLPQNEGEIKKTASFIRNKYLSKDPNKNVIKDKNLYINLPEDMPAVIEKVYENQDAVFDWNEEHEDDLKKRKVRTYNPKKKEEKKLETVPTKKEEPAPPKRDYRRNKVANETENNERKFSFNFNKDKYTTPKREEKTEPVRRVNKVEEKPVLEVKIEKIVEPEPEKVRNMYKNAKTLEKKFPSKDNVVEVEVIKEVEVKPTYVVENEYEEVDENGVPVKSHKSKRLSYKKRENDTKPTKEFKYSKTSKYEKKEEPQPEEPKPQEPKKEIRKREIFKTSEPKAEEPKRQIRKREINKREITNPDTQTEQKIIITEINISEPSIKEIKPENLRDLNKNSETQKKKERKLIRPGLPNKEIKYTKHTTYTRTQEKPDTKTNNIETSNTSSSRRKYYTVRNENIKTMEPEPEPENVEKIRKKYDKYENYKDEDDEVRAPSNPIRIVNKTLTETIFGPEDDIDNKNINKRIIVETTEEKIKPRLSNDYYSNSKKLKENKFNNNESGNNNKKNTGTNRSFQKRTIKKYIPQQYCKYNTDSNLIEDLGSIEEINVNNYLRDDLAEIYNKIDEEFYDLKNDVFYANICNFEDRFGEFDRSKIPPTVKKFEIKTVKEKKSTNDMIRKYAHRARLIREENEKYKKH